MKKRRSLDVKIRWKSKGVFSILIDGDSFWADSYNHAVAVVLEILTRDEIDKGKLH